LNTKAKEAGFMTKITYIPPAGDAAECLWGGYLFKENVPLDVLDLHIITKAGTNRHFRVEADLPPAAPAEKPAKPKPEAPKPEAPKPDPKAEGFAAARDGKTDTVPKAYRGTPDEALWILGFMSFEKAAG
jgi:hypothetical protein